MSLICLELVLFLLCQVLSPVDASMPFDPGGEINVIDWGGDGGERILGRGLSSRLTRCEALVSFTHRSSAGHAPLGSLFLSACPRRQFRFGWELWVPHVQTARTPHSDWLQYAKGAARAAISLGWSSKGIGQLISQLPIVG